MYRQVLLAPSMVWRHGALKIGRRGVVSCVTYCGCRHTHTACESIRDLCVCVCVFRRSYVFFFLWFDFFLFSSYVFIYHTTAVSTNQPTHDHTHTFINILWHDVICWLFYFILYIYASPWKFFFFFARFVFTPDTMFFADLFLLFNPWTHFDLTPKLQSLV